MDDEGFMRAELHAFKGRNGICMKALETIQAQGHENIASTNRTTFEITKETHLTRRGDCIIAVGADKGAADLSSEFKKVAGSDTAQITIAIAVADIVEVARAIGGSQLPFTHPTDLVVRKSDYICGRTLAIKADKAAADFSLKLVEKLRCPLQSVRITLTATDTFDEWARPLKPDK